MRNVCLLVFAVAAVAVTVTVVIATFPGVSLARSAPWLRVATGTAPALFALAAGLLAPGRCHRSGRLNELILTSEVRL